MSRLNDSRTTCPDDELAPGEKRPGGLVAPSAGGAGMSFTAISGVVVLVIAALVFALAFVNFFYSQSAHSDISGRPYKVEITQAAASDMKPIVESYIAAEAKEKMELSAGGDADIFIGEEPRKGYDATRVVGMPAQTLTAGSAKKVLRPQREYWYCYKRTGVLLRHKDPEVDGLEHYIRDYYSVEPVTFTAVGDIIPARHVAEVMAEKGTEYPFKPALPLVKGSDLVAGGLECPLTDRVEAPYSGMVFAAPTEAVEGLNLLGIRVVTLANNHSTNFGRLEFIDTLETLEANGIEYAGGGRNYREAHEPAIVEAGGIRFAFLSYNSIKGSIDATADEAGVVWINMPPFNAESEEDFRQVESEIREAAKKADFVVPFFHWSEEYAYEPNSSMTSLAHRAIDAGADMVLGQHPHTIQTVEYYKGKLIAYSMGNFVFDQRHVEIKGKDIGEQTRKGFVIRSEFRRGFQLDLAFLPYRIDDTCRTVPLEGKAAQSLIDKLFRISGWRIEGDSI